MYTVSDTTKPNVEIQLTTIKTKVILANISLLFLNILPIIAKITAITKAIVATAKNIIFK